MAKSVEHHLMIRLYGGVSCDQGGKVWGEHRGYGAESEQEQDSGSKGNEVRAWSTALMVPENSAKENPYRRGSKSA